MIIQQTLMKTQLSASLQVILWLLQLVLVRIQMSLLTHPTQIVVSMLSKINY
jgi:hypothetical protein